MQSLKIIFSITLLAFLFNEGCVHTEKASASFVQLLKSNDTSKKGVKFNGAYHHLNKESYNYPTNYQHGKPTRYIDTPYLEQPLYFFKNGILLFEYGGTTLEASDLSLSDYKSSKVFYNEKGWGRYSIKKDTIYAIIYVDFINGIFYPGQQRLSCNFQGVLKNDDTILHFSLIPPLPHINKRFPNNTQTLEYLKTPVDLYFKTVSEKEFMDPNKAWINKLKQNDL